MHPEYRYVTKVRLTPVKAIREYCKKTCAGSPKEVRLCPVSECPLHPYKMGTQPSRSGIGGGPRSPRGIFLSRNSHTTAKNPIMTPNMGKSSRAHHGSTMREFEGSEIEETKGQIRIEKTSSGLLIRLTQAPQLH